MSEKDGGQAFPMPSSSATSIGAEEWNRAQFGMTLRDWFAGKALSGLLCGDSGDACEGTTPNEIEQEQIEYAKRIAKASYRYADEMLKERAK